MKIGLTGATGVLGRIILNKLLSRNNHIVSCFGGDICSRADIKLWLDKDKLDVIIHLAALVPTDKVEGDCLSAYKVNVGGTINLLSEIKGSDNKTWLFYASSSHVYKSKDTPINENDEIDPVSLYGMTKYMGERICSDVGQNEIYNISVCVGRVFSFYHKTQRKPFLYPSIIERLNTEDLNENFFLYGADSERDISNAEYIVDVIVSLMENKVRGVVNIGSGKAIKIRDFVQNLSNKKLNITTENKKDFLVADISKFKNLIKEK